MQSLLHFFFREGILHLAEEISHCIVLTLLVFQGKVVISQTGHPPMPSCIEISREEDVSKRIVSRADNKLIYILPIGSQIFMKLLCDSPFQSKKLFLVRIVSLLSLVHSSACISHWMISTIILFLRENSSQAFPRGVCLQQERFLEITERQYWSIHSLLFEDIECLKSLVR